MIWTRNHLPYLALQIELFNRRAEETELTELKEIYFFVAQECAGKWLETSQIEINIYSHLQYVNQLRMWVATCPVCSDRVIAKSHTTASNHVNEHKWGCGQSMSFRYPPLYTVSNRV